MGTHQLSPHLYSPQRFALWYALVHTNQSNSGSADSENYRVVNSAYELRIHAFIILSQFSEFLRPLRIQYCPSRLRAKPVRTPSERGLDLFLSTSYRCNDWRFNRQTVLPMEVPVIRSAKAPRTQVDLVLHPPHTNLHTLSSVLDFPMFVSVTDQIAMTKVMRYLFPSGKP